MADTEGEAPAAEETQPEAVEEAAAEDVEEAPAETAAEASPAAEVPGEGEAGTDQPASGEDATIAEGDGETGDGEAKPEEVDAKEAEGGEADPEGEAPPAGDGDAEAPGDDAAAAGSQEEGEEKPGDAEGAEGAEPAGDGQEAAEEGAEKSEGVEESGEGEVKAEGEEGEKEKGEDEENPENGEEKTDDAEKKDDAQPEEEEIPKAEDVPVDDRAESPVAVGEKLSRGATPADLGDGTVEQERLEATTPERLLEEHEHGLREEDMVVEEEEEEEEEEEMEPQFKREELIERYHEALADREQLQQQNYSLQHKLAEYFRKKKADERQDYDKNVTDQEQRYLKYMAQLEDLRRQDAMEKENYRAQIEEAKARCQVKKETVDLERTRFMEFKMQVAIKAINSRSGKPIPQKDLDQYVINENKKEKEVVDVRLENIKLKNKLKKKEQQLKSKEELAEGLHLIDFEQLKIENQTYNEKIEERNEELLKLRKKITSTVQVLTHLKEKLQFVQGENLEQSENLKKVESSLAQSRDILSRTKQARDALRIDNQRLRQSCGLLGNEALLRDFEERKDEGDDLKDKLEQLKMKHAELTLHCNQVRRKIEQTRATMT